VTKKSLQSLFLLLICLLAIPFAQAEDSVEFPGREKYLKVPYIELEDLFANFEESVIIDVRSEYEYNTLKIKGSINVPIANLRQFENELTRLRAEFPQKRLVFYCNGKTCMKSYKATVKAQAMGLENIYAYDAGVFDWVKAHPDLGELLGRSPVRPEQLIGKEQLAAHMLDPEAFSMRVRELKDKAVVMDVRDPFQREGVGFFPGHETNVPLDAVDKLSRAMTEAKAKGQTLFIYDAVGKQVAWMQYSLEDAGVKDYFFMDGGAKAYYDWISGSMWKK